MSPVLLVIFFLIAVYKLYEFLTWKPPNSPPGLLRVPYSGSYWFLLWGNYNFPHKNLEYYVKKFKSSVISLYLGDFYAVIANDYKSIKEVFTNEDLDGRLSDVHVLKARAYGKKLGIFFTEGKQWQEQRRFALRHMRDFGFGRRQEKLEIGIMEELNILLDTIKRGPINDIEKSVCKDGMALFPNVLFPVSANNIWSIMFGYKFDRNEHDKLHKFCESAIIFQRAADTTGGAIFQRPSLRHFGNLFGYKNVIKGNYGMLNFIKEYLKQQKSTWDENTDRGLVDRYLQELMKREDLSFFSEEQLEITLLDFMFPALSAIPVTITHGIKYLMHNPRVLKSVQEEIDRVVGTGRTVTWEDRKSLPYTEATIKEILRIETLTPFGVIHKCVRNTTLCGYNIPVNTAVITNLAGMNHDRDFWGDPENFRPERFLNDNGELGKDPTFPFGFGHRVCAGETFARYTLFGTFAALVQNFNFSFVKGQPTGLDDKIPGLIVTPKETWIKLESRY